jgi:hypothetical protein
MTTLLLSLWLWDAVARDCHGFTERNPAGMHYELADAQRRIVGWVPQEDGSLGPVYALEPWRIIGATFGLSAQWAEPVVQTGECAYLRVVAIDAAGNRDDGVCR